MTRKQVQRTGIIHALTLSFIDSLSRRALGPRWILSTQMVRRNEKNTSTLSLQEENPNRTQFEE
jgi:hypothetical protein